ncbi:ABC transporter permease [Nannocystaceae bacterium ST9]
MNYQVLKAWTDVKAGGGRSLLVLFALILGVWGLGSVAVAYGVLSRDLRSNFEGTMPPHAVVTLAEPGGLDLDALRRRPDIESAELRDLAMLRIEVHPGEWIPLWLFGVQDFQAVELARIVGQDGAAEPRSGAMLIERNGRLVSNLDSGSIARVRSGSRRLEIPIDGIVFDPAQAPATQDHFIYAYTDARSFAAMTGEASGRRLLLRFRDVASKPEVEHALAQLRATWPSDGPAIASVVVPAFLEHPHQWQLDMLIAIIGSIGLLAFLLGSVLVSQIVGALVASQVRQIGIMKALGATRARVVGLFALYLLVFAVASGLVGIPLALLTGYRFSAFCAGILNFEILTTRAPAEVLALLVVTALMLPFSFAAPSLMRAGGISVREALGESKPRVRARLSRRVATTIATTALGVAIFSTGFNVRQSLFEFVTTTRDSMRHDVQVVLDEPMDEAAFRAVFADVAGIEAVEAWTGGKGELQSRVASTDEAVGIVALPLDSRMLAASMSEGRWLGSLVEPEIVANQAALERLGMPRVGDPLTIRVGGQPRHATLVGVIEEFDRPKIYVVNHIYAAWANPEQLVNTLLFAAEDDDFAGVMALKRAIEQAVDSSELDVLYVMSQAERAKIIVDHLNIILVTLLVLAFLVLSVSALGMASAMSISVMERTREIGVMRAIGATPARVVRIFVGEGMAASMAGLVLGLALSWPLSRVAAKLFGTLMLGEGGVLRFAFSPVGFAITLVTSIGFAYLASRLPASVAGRLSVREALAYE